VDEQLADALRPQALEALVELAAAKGKSLLVGAIAQRDHAVPDVPEEPGIRVERVVQGACVVGHVARAIGGRADEVKRIFIEGVDRQAVHHGDLDFADQIGAVHLDGLRHVLGRVGHGADEDLELH
jgi:hypothetical protein